MNNPSSNRFGNCAVDIAAFIGKTTLPDGTKYRAMKRFALIPRMSNGFLWLRWVIDIQADDFEGWWITLTSYPEETFRNHF